MKQTPLNSSSPDRKLLPGDINRKERKAERKFSKLKGDGSNRDLRKYKKGMKAKYQAETGTDGSPLDMHKGKKHKSVMEGYSDFARSEGTEAKKYVDSVRTNDPFAKGVDDMMDEESRRRERGFYVKGTTVSKKGITSTPEDSALNMIRKVLKNDK
tara:strand:+ start:511 stop:978 length:468 start_codon:yes stop_codon:yes gene_type:complete